MKPTTNNTPHIWISETYIIVETDKDGNQTRCLNYESEPYKTRYSENQRGRLFKDLQKQFGKCTNKVYIDQPDGTIEHIGWIFIKRRKYERSKDTYIQEVWIIRHTPEPQPIQVTKLIRVPMAI